MPPTALRLPDGHVVPSYDGAGLVNLVAELERRLTGTAPHPGLTPELSAAVPEAETYVLLLLDGLGDAQLAHPAAAQLLADRAGVIHAPFPTMTTVSMATIATGRTPTEHGVIGHLVSLPDVGEVVNVLKWITLHGRRLDVDTSDFLPGPNLWERLKAAGREPITVQPGDFLDTPFSRSLYRGCRFEPVYDERELADAAVQLAREPGRLVFTYLPHVDFAAHVWGQASPEYEQALRLVDSVWASISRRLPDGAVLLGTADHGHLDYGAEDKLLVRGEAYDDVVFSGDPRAVMVAGEAEAAAGLAAETGGHLLGPDAFPALWGPGTPHPALASRAPDHILLAPPGHVVLPRGFDKRLTGYHGGLDRAEVEIPLLVG